MISVTTAVATRRSIRAFEDRPVDAAMLTRVLDKARMAPSSLNMQPWHAVALSGQPLADLSAAMLAGPAQTVQDYTPSSIGVPETLLARRDAIMAPRFAALGIARDDQAARAAYQRRNYSFFGAPVCLFTFLPASISPVNLGSAGMWMQTVMLLLVEQGLASCPQESLAHYGAIIKAHCGIEAAEFNFWCGLAIGWPDKAAPVNNYDRPRVPLAEQVTLIGFE